MKAFSSLVVLRAPPEDLFVVMRDRLVEIASSIAEVSAIVELERVDEPEGVLVVNRWLARQTAPQFLRARLGGAEISWIDRAQWSRAALACHWSIEPSLGDGAICCTGATRFAPAMAGRGARLTFEGQISIRPEFVTSIVGSFEAPVRAFVESMATTLLPANFRSAAEAAVKLC